MKRNMDLIRALLFQWESGGQDLTAFSEAEQIYHTALLIEAGYLIGEIIPGDTEDGSGVVGNCVSRLSWAGHDFIDSARSQSVWEKVKAALSGTAGTAGIETVKMLLLKFVALKVGLDSGVQP